MPFARFTLLRPIAVALILSVVAASWCWWGAGATLGLFLGAPLLAALFVPPLVAVERGWGRVASALSAIAGVAIVWAAAAGAADVTIDQWLRCTLVLGALVVALAGCAAALSLVRIPWPIAAGLVSLLALLWLTWPVWLSNALTQDRVDWLVPAHPVLAINGVVAHLGAWDRMPIAYRSLTVLNQDIPYHLPRSIVPAVLAHLALGIPLLVLALRVESRAVTPEVPTNPPEPPEDLPAFPPANAPGNRPL